MVVCLLFSWLLVQRLCWEYTSEFKISQVITGRILINLIFAIIKTSDIQKLNQVVLTYVVN